MSPRPRGPHSLPRTCPVCSGRLRLSAATCVDCGTELHGRFRTCEFCGLDDHQRALLRTFLTARGNIKELERHLGVSYPTARARLDELLRALGIDVPDKPRATSRRDLLDAVARGEIDVDTAMENLS